MIRFRCIRCQHAVQTSDDAVGRKMYCPVCYLELTVPAESTIKPVDESRLYTADAAPVDVREMDERKKLVSLRCPVCHTNITVSREQIGTETACPECETKVFVPNSIAEKIDKSLADKIMSGLGGSAFGSVSGSVSSEKAYGLRGSDSADPSNDGAIRVYCKLCGTMMYAPDDKIGTEIICPDCETKNIVPPRPKKIPVPPPLPTTFEGATTFGVADNASAAGPLVPVVCSLCGTRMYAQESEIGGVKTCPDCGRQTEIKAVPKSERVQSAPSPGGAYGVSNEEAPAKRPTFRTLTDYRYVEGSLDKELYDAKPPEPRTPSTLPIFPILYDPDSKTKSEPSQAPDADRERQILKKAGFDADNHLVQNRERLPLPKHPFWTRIFVPFTVARLWGLTIAASCCGMAGFVVGSILPGLWAVVSAPFGFIILMLGLSLLANTYLSLFLWTTVGNDLPDKDDWQEYKMLESMALTVWLFLLVILAASPGYLLMSFLPLATPESAEPSLKIYVSYFLLELGSSILFFPIFFLSSMEAGSYFVVLAKETCRSLLGCPWIWLRFYAVSLLLAVIFCAIIIAVSTAAGENLLAGLAAVIPVCSVFALFYARFLGRLGWTLEELGRMTSDE